MMINQWSLSGRSSPSRLCRVGSLNARLAANAKAAWEHDIDGMAKPGALEPPYVQHGHKNVVIPTILVGWGAGKWRKTRRLGTI